MEILKSILQFISNYWEYFSVGFLAIANIVLFLLKKKPIQVCDDANTMLYSVLPDLIRTVEQSIGAGHGSDKKTKVVELALSLLKTYFPKLDLDGYKPLIERAVENILSTPQKKGVK